MKHIINNASGGVMKAVPSILLAAVVTAVVISGTPDILNFFKNGEWGWLAIMGFFVFVAPGIIGMVLGDRIAHLFVAIPWLVFLTIEQLVGKATRLFERMLESVLPGDYGTEIAIDFVSYSIWGAPIGAYIISFIILSVLYVRGTADRDNSSFAPIAERRRDRS